jgi:hypothetical protein
VRARALFFVVFFVAVLFFLVASGFCDAVAFCDAFCDAALFAICRKQSVSYGVTRRQAPQSSHYLPGVGSGVGSVGKKYGGGLGTDEMYGIESGKEEFARLDGTAHTPPAKKNFFLLRF